MSDVNQPSSRISKGPEAGHGGRRVFFLYPPSVVEESMIQFLITAQYEVAVIRDHRAVVPVIKKFPNSIIFCNLDSKVDPGEMEKLIRHVVSSKEDHGCEIGVLSYNKDPELAERYLIDIGVTAGYVTLKIGFEQSARIIIKTLEAAEARGRRKFVRVKVPSGKGSIGIKMGRRSVDGQLLDVSVAGVACKLPEEFETGTLLEDVQLRLWGSIAKVSGKIAGFRGSKGNYTYVVMFDEPLTSISRGRIYGFIRKVLQTQVDALLPKRT